VSDPTRRRLLLLGLSFVGFVSLGLPDGLLGVAWPSIRASFDLALDALGPLLVATTSGYVLASFASGRILARISVGALLVLSCLATAASLTGYALAPSWGVMVGFGLLAGLGAGAIDAGLNTHVATHHGARTLNWLHACYGVGAAGGPVLMACVLMMGLAWQRGYAWVAAGQAILAACFLATLRLWPNPRAVRPGEGSLSARAGEPGAAAARPASQASTLRLPAAWLGIAAFFVYTGLEASAGAWAYSLLTESRGVGAMTAGSWVSFYWGGLGAGRLVFGFLVGSAPLHALLRASLLGILLGAGLVTLDVGALPTFLGLALLGLASGPIFPSLIATTPERLGAAHTANGVGFQIAAAALGQALLPALVGVLAGRLGLEVLGPSLLAAAVALFAVHEAIVRTAATGSARRGVAAPAGA
jgi:fucose permease